MPTHLSTPPRPHRGRLGILLGLSGLGAGVAAILTGYEALGFAAGVLAIVGPTVMLKELPHVPHPDRAEEPPPETATAMAEEHMAIQPFHMDSELLTAEYFNIAVKNRMTAARRFLKPLAIVQLKMTGNEAPESIDAQASAAVLNTLRDCDTAYVMDSGHLALVLEDTPESGAIWAVERIRRNLASTGDELTVWAGIACYPAHGMDTDEIITQCEEALQRAQEWPQDRIEVALAD